jgi:hypothetical protein
MAIANLAIRVAPEHSSALETLEDLVFEATDLVDRWFQPARQEGQG